MKFFVVAMHNGNPSTGKNGVSSFGNGQEISKKHMVCFRFLDQGNHQVSFHNELKETASF